MAGDDDVTIKLAADVDAALRGVMEVVANFENMGEAITTLEGIAESFGITTQQMLGEVSEKLAASSIASTEYGEQFGNALIAVEEQLIANAAAQEAATASGVTSVQALAEVEKEYADQKAADTARVSAMSDESKAAIDKSTEALLKQGLSLKEVAAASDLTVGALKLIIDEQNKLEASSKTTFDKFIEGIKGSEVATVAAGVLMADALKGVGNALLDVATGFPNMISAAAKAGDEMQTAANRFNMSVESIDRMKFVADQANVSFDGMARASQRLTSQLSDDSSKASKAFQEMGLNAEELRKDPEQALYAFIKAVKETVPPADQAAKMTEVLGSRAGALTGLLKENIDKLAEDAAALGASAEATRIVAEEGEEYQDNLGRIKRAQEAWRDEIASHFLPVINDVLHAMPELGGAILTVGEGMLSAGSKMLPLLTNIMALKGSGLATTLLSWVGNLFGLTSATVAQTTATGALATTTGTAAVATEGMAAATAAGAVATETATVATWGLNAALGPVVIALGAAYAIWKVWNAASEESGWVRYVSDGFERLSLGLMGYTKAQTEAMIAQEHATQKTTEAAAAAKKLADEKMAAAEKEKAAQELLDAALAKQGTGLERLAKSSKEVQDATNAMTDAQKAGIKDALAHGKSAKEIAEILHRDLKGSTEAVTQAIKLYDDSLKAADKSAKQAEKTDPFSKMAKSAKELSMALAASGGSEITQLVAEYGKKAFEVVNLAATMQNGLDKITPAAMKVAEAFQRAEIDKELVKIKKSSEDAATALREKMEAGATAAVAAVKGMADSMREATLTGDDLRLFQIEKQRDSAIAAQEAIMANAIKTRDKENAAAKAAYDADEKMLQAKRLAGQQVSVEDQAAIATAFEARVNASEALAAQVQRDAENQILMTRTVADQQAQIVTEGTGVYEKDAETRGVISKKAAAKELDVQSNKLKLMKAAGSAATKFEIEQQERLVADLQSLTEKDLAQRGLMTIAAREKQYTVEKEKLKAMLAAQKLDVNAFYQWEIDEQARKVAQMESASQKEAHARGLRTKADLEEEAKQHKETLDYMLQHEKDYTKQQIAEQKKRRQESEEAAHGTWSAWEKTFGDMARLSGAVGSAVSEIGKQMDNPAVQKFGEGIQFASEMLSGMQGIAGAMAKGDTIGAIIAGIGMAIKAVGKLWDAFSESKGEKAMKSINKTFKDTTGEMLDVSEDFGNKIAEDAKKWFGGDAVQAQIYNLHDIIEEAGGLSEKNFENMEANLMKVFDQIDKGSFTVEHATKVLDENFSTFANHILETGKVASKGFVELIALNKVFGTQSKEIADFVAGQVARLGGAFETMLAPIAKHAEWQSEKVGDEFKKLEKLTDDRNKLLADFAREGPDRMGTEAKAKLAELTAEWEKQTGIVEKERGVLKDMAVAAMPDLHRAGNLLTASFNAATASGMSMLDAVDQLGPGLDALIQSTADLGLTAEEGGWQWLAAFRDKVNVNRELVDSSQSLNEIMLAMSNIGALNAESFADLQAQGNDTYADLIAAGFTENEALTMQKDFLQQVRDAHVELGLPIDENTQKLIDQATEAGVLKEQEMSTNAIMMEGLTAIIKALGGDVPAAFQKMTGAGKDTAAEMGRLSKAIDDKVKKSVTEVTKEVEETPWEDYATAGVTAAGSVKLAVDPVAAALQAVAERLGDADWAGWADAAVTAAEKVSDAVDAVSLGHSPGGIKEMPIKLNEANKAFKQWERQGVVSASAVEEAINSIGANQQKALQTSLNNAAGGGGRIASVGDIHVTINTEAIDNSQRSREVAEEIMDQFTQILARRTQFGVTT